MNSKTLTKPAARWPGLSAGVLLMAVSSQAFAQLEEAEGALEWVLDIFSPTLLLGILTLLIIGCGIAVYFRRLTGEWAVRIVLGSVLLFGAPTIAVKIAGLFGGGAG